jgi:hypothetical protein
MKRLGIIFPAAAVLVLLPLTSIAASAPPVGVTAIPIDFNWVEIRWSDPAADTSVTGYTVYRDGTVFSQVGANRSWFWDTTVAPATSYLYEVDAYDAAGNRSARSASAVTTPPRPPEPVVAAAGDISCAPADSSFNGGDGTSRHCRQKYTSESLVNAGFTAVLALGDTQYYKGEYSNYLKAYRPSWGRVKSTTHPVPGNHEYLTSGASGFFRYFGSAAGTRGYYSYDLGDWHLIALNSNIARGPGSAQLSWLKKDLTANSAVCTLAYWHHSRWSSSRYSSDSSVAPFWNALYEAGVDVVLNGHNHVYERFAPQSPSGAADWDKGIRQFIVGTGGEELYGFPRIRANSEARGRKFGVLMLTLESSSYSWRFVPEAGGTFTDSGNTACH